MGAAWQAYQDAWRLLWKDKELLLVPLLAAFITVSLWVLGFAVLAITFTPQPTNLHFAALAFVFALGLAAAFTFAKAFTCAVAFERISGGNPTFATGVRAVRRRAKPLLAWTLAYAFAVTLLALLARMTRRRAPSMAGGVAFEIATMFVVPSIMLDNHGASGALRRSGTMVFDRFGGVTRRAISFGLIGGIIAAATVFAGLQLGGFVLSVLPDSLLHGWTVVPLLIAPVLLAWLFLALHGVASVAYDTAVYLSVTRDQRGWFQDAALLAPFQ